MHDFIGKLSLAHNFVENFMLVMMQYIKTIQMFYIYTSWLNLWHFICRLFQFMSSDLILVSSGSLSNLGCLRLDNCTLNCPVAVVKEYICATTPYWDFYVLRCPYKYADHSDDHWVDNYGYYKAVCLEKKLQAPVLR